MTWVELACRDVDQATAFYAGVLGWQATTRPFGEGSTYTDLSRGDDGQKVAGIVQMNELWPPEVPAHWMLYFAVADTDATAARADQLGGKVGVQPFDMPGVGRAAMLNDPDGGYFSILQRA
jgi:predicted enzyme related to lactoylglutathione lyase